MSRSMYVRDVVILKIDNGRMANLGRFKIQGRNTKDG